MNVRVAVLGTGKMGSAIARRLAGAGSELVLWNRTRERAEQVGVGTVEETAAEAAANAEIVITSLTGPDALRATFSGPAGVLAGAHGQVFVEMSTAGPDVLAELEPLVTATGSAIIDAPIIGAPTSVLAGTALLVVGGAHTDVWRVQPLLEMLGDVQPVGALGNGARLKLVANSMLGVLTLTAAELQAGGETSGLDPDVVFAILSRYAPGLELRRGGYLHDGYSPPLFAIRDLRKDLVLADDLFARTNASTPMTSLARRLLDTLPTDTAGLDISGVILPYRTGRMQPARTELQAALTAPE